MPKRLLKSGDISIMKNGIWTIVYQIKDNHQRLINLDISDNIEGVKIDNMLTWEGLNNCNIFSFEAY